MQIRIVSGFGFCRRSWRLKVNIRCTFAHFRKSHVRAISWMCKKQTSVSHISTKAEIISLAAGLRMDGIPAIDLLDLVREVFQCSANKLKNTKGQVQGNLSRNTTSNKHTQNKTKVPTQHDNFDLNNVDCVPSNAKFSRFGAVLYIFENNEAVIKMIIKGRSPTMRHVSRTHRVALDWLLDRINRDHQNQIKCVDTKHQLAEILTKGNFTRDEWNNLLYLFNISHFSSLCCAQNFSLTSCTKTRARRIAFSVSTSSSIVNSPIASKSPGILKAPRRTDWSSTGKPDAKDRNLDAASSSQGWQKDAFLDLCTEKLVAAEEDQEHLNYPEDSVSTGKPLSQNIQDIQETQETQEPKAMTKIGHTISRLQQITCCTWRRSSRSWDKDTVAVRRIKWKTSMWTQRYRVYLCLSLFKLQFIFGKDYSENLRSTKNQPLKSLRQIFQVTERLIKDQTESTGLTTIDWQQPMWRETTLLNDKAVQFATAKTYVFSDSVLCLGGISDEPVKACKSRIKLFLETRCLKDLDRIGGEPMEFDWENLLGFTTLGILDEIQNMMTESKSEPEQFKGRIIFMSMHNDIDWTKRGKKKYCVANALKNCWVCSKIHARTSVASGAWIREEMVQNPCQQTGWRMG